MRAVLPLAAPQHDAPHVGPLAGMLPSGYRPEFFKDTVEYAWLRRHGAEFGFHESWQEGNDFGMRAEPWHWQYRPAGPA